MTEREREREIKREREVIMRVGRESEDIRHHVAIY